MSTHVSTIYPPAKGATMSINLPNLQSAAFWSALGGAAATILGALGYAHDGTAVNALLVAIGGVLIAVPTHHVVAKQQASK